MKTIDIYNLGNLPTAPLDDFFDLQEDFKIEDPDRNAKLQMLILTRGFKYAFKAWRDEDGKLWIIDAHQRKKALIALRAAGFDIPPIPYEPIHAATKKEAVEEIAAYNSEFARKNPDTLLFKKYAIDGVTMRRFSLDVIPIATEVRPTAIASPLGDPLSDEDTDDTLPAVNDAFARSGDIWLLGDHRLLCGDCRSTKEVSRLMDGRLADICITDPPYNVNYTGGTADALSIDNDAMDNDSFALFLSQVFKNISAILRPGAAAYIFHADSEGENFRRAFRNANFHLAQCLVWVKNNIVIGRQDYQWKHEPCLYGWKKGASHRWHADRKQSTVLSFDKPQRSSIHPTMKPTPLIAYLMRNSSADGQLVVDLFSGSGSTLIAAQQISRICYAMEIDPQYVSATVLRFRELFRHLPIRLVRDGKTIEVDNPSLLLPPYADR